ncbi:hypothetical protein D8M04_18790 [Oceanobacillus piezotolerans]|uniref:Uncharacterized protein n=1 Tax=Oceanobacillus piezotolerans TaxID=2448030 RepID=A0A498D4I4_9BACI|nr:hypothetical protein [Oceanobacillus piezotolerans]RLL40595.1 hypothetical protein D8M04_18790 [Oceanobacillus piezotolerans]
MRTSLELFRIIIIFMVLGALGWGVIGNVYTINETTESYSWLSGIAIFILLFVLYRNKLQFSGWYKGKGKAKLPKSVTGTLILSSILLIILPFAISSLLS